MTEALSELGLHRIMVARGRKSIELPKFKIPEFNFKGEDYYAHVDRQSRKKETEPSLAMEISDAALKQMVVDGVPAEVFDFQNESYHIIEQCVQLVTEALDVV